MAIPTYLIKLRRFDCHPETCCHDDHSPWWLWDTKSHYYYLGFDSKTDATDFCVQMGHRYQYESDLIPSLDAF